MQNKRKHSNCRRGCVSSVSFFGEGGLTEETLGGGLRLAMVVTSLTSMLTTHVSSNLALLSGEWNLMCPPQLVYRLIARPCVVMHGVERRTSLC